MNSNEACRILGVSNDAQTESLKKAYKRLAKQHHPDMGGDATKFHKVKEAFDTLTKGVDSDGNRFNMDDIFNTFFKGARPFAKHAKQKVRLPEIQVTLQEAYRGGLIERNVKVQVPCGTCSGLGRTGAECPHCKGMGFNQRVQKHHFMNTDICGHCFGTGFSEKCPTCNGKGVSIEINTLAVKLPPLVYEGAILSNMNRGLHRKVRVRIKVPKDYKVFPGKILYTPEVELINVMKGYLLDVLGTPVKIPPFTFNEINVNNNILIRPIINVEDPSIFDAVVREDE